MRFRTTVILLCVAVVASAILGAAFWISSFAYDAEHALQATCLASRATETYIRGRKKWPTSWRDLESVSVDNGQRFSWPRDSAMVRTYVEMDFDRTIDEIACQNVESFDAIRPKVPAYRSYHNYFSWLIEAAKDVKLDSGRHPARRGKVNQDEGEINEAQNGESSEHQGGAAVTCSGQFRSRMETTAAPRIPIKQWC